MWEVRFTKNATKDMKLIKNAGLDIKTKNIIKAMMVNPFTDTPSYEKLKGKLDGYYSRRINIQHRLVYRLDELNKIIIVSSMWSHYE